MDRAEVLSVIKELVQTLEDGQAAFRLAAGSMDHSEVKMLFAHYSQLHAQFADELRHLADSFGDLHEKGFSQDFHRGWIYFRNTVSARDPLSMLSECERTEDHALHEYRRALGQDLPTEIRHAVGAQSLDVKAAHDKIKYLRDLAARAA